MKMFLSALTTLSLVFITDLVLAQSEMSDSPGSAVGDTDSIQAVRPQSDVIDHSDKKRMLAPRGAMIRGGSAPTAENQGTTPVEAETTRKIREALMADPSLSMAAKNITVVTKGQSVTLRGNVKSDAERVAVERIAKKTAGKMSVVNSTQIR